MKPDLPANESARLLKLETYGLLDTPPDPAFDGLTALAAEVTRAPIAVLSLVDRDRKWFKSRFGLALHEVPRAGSFCAQVVATELPLFVTDATQDARFADNPLVKGPTAVRAYAGFPLRTPDGFVLGTLAVMDPAVREWTPHQRELLRMLTHQCVDQLEWRRQTAQGRSQKQALLNELRQTSDEASRLESILACANLAIIETSPDGIIREFNPAAERMLGYEAGEVIGKATPALFHDPTETAARGRSVSSELGAPVSGFEALIARARYGAPDEYECTHLHKDGTRFPVHLSVTARRDAAGHIVGYLGVVSDWSGHAASSARVEQHAAAVRFQADVCNALGQPVAVEAQLQACTEAVVKDLDAALARIWLLDPQGHTLELRASAGLTTALDGPASRIPLGKNKVGTIAQRRQPELDNAVLDDPRLADPTWARQERLTSFAGCPLLLGDQVLGVVAMFARHPLPPTVFTQLGFLAAHASVALGKGPPRAG